MATAAQGFIKVQIDMSATETPDYQDVKGVFDVNGGGRTDNPIPATDFDTPAGETEEIPGPRGNNPYTFNMHYEQGEETQEKLFTSEATNTPVKIRIKFGSGVSAKGVTYPCVPVLALAASVEGKVTYSASVKPLTAAQRGTAT